MFNKDNHLIYEALNTSIKYIDYNYMYYISGKIYVNVINNKLKIGSKITWYQTEPDYQDSIQKYGIVISKILNVSGVEYPDIYEIYIGTENEIRQMSSDVAKMLSI